MGRIDDKFNWCLKKGDAGDKHKGLKKIKPDYIEAEKQIREGEKMPNLLGKRCSMAQKHPWKMQDAKSRWTMQ